LEGKDSVDQSKTCKLTVAASLSVLPVVDIISRHSALLKEGRDTVRNYILLWMSQELVE